MIDHPDHDAAYAALAEAIRVALHASGGTGLLMEWVLVASTHHTRDDGSTGTAVPLITSPELPVYRLLGLLGYADAVVRLDLTTAEALDDPP